MKWSNCTQAEAQEAYDYAKSRYKGAAEEYLYNKKKIDSCYSAYSGMASRTEETRSEKLSFERRIAEMEDIIRLISDGGMVDSAVEEANNAAKAAEDALAQSIVCSGVNSPPLSSIFRCPTVSENSYSLTALNELKKEKARLEQALAEVNAKLNALELEVQQLTSQINSLAAEQSRLSRQMNACSFEMNHYKKYT